MAQTHIRSQYKIAIRFLEELNECVERAFGDNAQLVIDSLLYAKQPPHLKRSPNLAHLENGTYTTKLLHISKEKWNSVVWKMMGSSQYPQ